MKLIIALLSLFVSVAAPQQAVTVHITDSDAIDLARKIARDEGYDVAKTDLYSFDMLRTPEGKPFLKGYTAVGFNINGNHRNLILINESTGQAIDSDTCEVFDYPDLLPFQEKIMSLSKLKRKTVHELANDAGCDSPRVLRKSSSTR